MRLFSSANFSRDSLYHVFDSALDFGRDSTAYFKLLAFNPMHSQLRGQTTERTRELDRLGNADPVCGCRRPGAPHGMLPIPYVHNARWGTSHHGIDDDNVIRARPGIYQFGRFAGADFCRNAESAQALDGDDSGTVVPALAIAAADNQHVVDPVGVIGRVA